MIKDLQKHLRAHGKERREKRQLLADKALARKRAGVQKATARRLRAVLDYRKHDRIEPITTPQGLAALKADHGDSHGNYADALRNQIRVRKYVYGMGDLPAIGGGSSDGELARLGTNWKVLDVVWSDVYGEVVVYYYDMDSVNAEGIEEKELMDSLDDAGDHLYNEHIEFSKIKEVMGWLRASKAAEAAS